METDLVSRTLYSLLSALVIRKGYNVSETGHWIMFKNTTILSASRAYMKYHTGPSCCVVLILVEMQKSRHHNYCTLLNSLLYTVVYCRNMFRAVGHHQTILHLSSA
jgi:hypothetical protein